MSSSPAIVVFAHVPPPHHGQSYMVQLMLDALRAGPGAPAVYHVDARVSESLADVGGSSARKLFLLLGYVSQAVGHRLKHGARVLYYIPAPAKKSAILRDVVALSLLRPFFPRIILHWHAVGLGSWVNGSDDAPEAPRGMMARLLRPVLRALLAGARPAISITHGNAPDAAAFAPHEIVVVPNGIPDPCGDFPLLHPQREERVARLHSWLDRQCTQPRADPIRVGYLGHCLRTKGFFEALEAVRLAAAARPDLAWQLAIAGTFGSAAEEAEGNARLETLRTGGVAVQVHGFLHGDEKKRFLRDTDVLLFPSWSESFGLVAVEALAFGLPVIASDIPGIRDVLDGTGCSLVPAQDPASLAAALCRSSSYPDPLNLRRRYEDNFTLDMFAARITAALE
jgi:glycosyltransferase involved in cell wall biosynthesis